MRRLRRDEAYHPFFLLYARLRLEVPRLEQGDADMLAQVQQRMARLLQHCVELAARAYQLPAEDLRARMQEAADTSGFTDPVKEAQLRGYMPKLTDALAMTDKMFSATGQ